MFTGGFSVEAVEAVCADGQVEGDVLDGMTSLEDKSLIGREDDAYGVRPFMLETIKEFAGERLEDSGEVEGLRGNHARFFDKKSILA